jgi:hypothetical protein
VPGYKIIYGNFFLYDEPGAPFFSVDVEDAKSLYIKEIPLSGTIEIEGGVGSGTGEMVLAHAIRV